LNRCPDLAYWESCVSLLRSLADKMSALPGAPRSLASGLFEK
jgi:hypothetical protein